MRRLHLYILLFVTLLPFAHLLAQDNRHEGLRDVNGVRDVTLDSLAKANQSRPISGSSRRDGHPVLFLVGNSTMRNGTLGNGSNGQWGWGYFAHIFFDARQVTVENHALGGTSPRTFYRKLWPDVLKGLRLGDFVALELGHNDNGPIDRDRARASYKGSDGHSPLSDDSLLVTVQETGVQEMVYTFGGYMRRFVKEIRQRGATPILLTLTPRNAYDPADSTRIDRKLTTFTPWIRALAEELHTPLIDLNDRSATKLERYGRWKTDYHFFGDKIHSSRFGAEMNARSFVEGILQQKDAALEVLRRAVLADTLYPVIPELAHVPQGVETTKDQPTASVRKRSKRAKDTKIRVFLTGDSTVKNADKDADGMWGWGAQAYTVFDSLRCQVFNVAKAGRSTRTYLNEGRWDAVYNSLQAGDYVLIQFGHNDIGPIDTQKERGVIACAYDTCHVYRRASDNQYEVVYSFGWYLRKFIQDVREKGAIPILVSLTPRNEWKDGKVERRNDTYGRWYREVADDTGVAFLDLHNLTADALDKMGQTRAKAMYCHDHTHTSLAGAQLNAHNIAKGLKQIHSPLRDCLK